MYYFICTLLPPLKVGKKASLSFKELDILLNDNLSKQDYLKTGKLRSYYDLENLRAFLQKKPLSPYGNYTQRDFEEMHRGQAEMPSNWSNFFEKHRELSSQRRFFSQLIVHHFREVFLTSRDFLREYIDFERKIRVLQAYYRANQLQRDLTLELQYEDQEEPFIREVLDQHKSGRLEFPEGFLELKNLLESHYHHSPVQLHRAICEYRFQKIRSFIKGSEFSIDYILAYMAQLILIEQLEGI